MIEDYPEAYRELCDRLGFDRGIPFTEKWSAGADFLQILVDQVRERKPQRILECSSGLTTLFMARACQLAGTGRVTSLENGPAFAQATRVALEGYGLEAWAEVLDAPLVETPLGDQCWQWYDLAALEAGAIDMLVIDGPPGFLQPLSRYPALPRLADCLAPGALILLDDAARPDEKAIVARWIAEYPGIERRWRATERGCVELRWPAQRP
ncbi:MAG: class I SAM-dependent methyltransferase [Gammaproteobacteria bacterium]|nr:MAG: class I SAM-dependent methyltransferase [Gammaproteobacteria bacterium]